MTGSSTTSTLKHMNAKALRELPKGTAYLMVQFGADSNAEVDRGAAAAGRAGRHRARPEREVHGRAGLEDELWQAREAGLGATAHLPAQPDTFEGWEDSAVRPSGSATTCAT